MTIIQTPEFASIIADIEQYIARESHDGSIFFRLSSASPKDVECPPIARSARDVFEMIIHSIRCQRELKSADHFSLVLAPFNPRIAPENEFRVFIVRGTIYAIANMARKEVIPDQKECIEHFAQSRAKCFPYHSLALDIAILDCKVIFIEFNPLDDELDTFGAFGKYDDAELRELLCQPTKRGKEGPIGLR